MPADQTHGSVASEQWLERVSAGGSLSREELSALASDPDILTIGMLADTVRRRLCGSTVTFLRVASVDVTTSATNDALPATAQEARLTGTAESLEQALAAVAAVRVSAGPRLVSGFAWADIERWGGTAGGRAAALRALRSAGLDALAELPVELGDGLPGALSELAGEGLGTPRLTVTRAAPQHERLEQFLRTAPLLDRYPGIVAIAPLPLSLNALRPSTGYDDVKTVALARLALPRVQHVQLDWLRYGPKLAQVALTFGADDIDNVSPSEETPDGRRRGVVEELKKNIESAGFSAVERDGRFGVSA
ncbi:MAG: hypothetical protein ABL986_06260 [Vicinamibacterales bacterium]